MLTKRVLVPVMALLAASLAADSEAAKTEGQARFSGEVNVPGRGRFEVALERVEIMTPDFRLLVDGRPVPIPKALHEMKLYRGALAEDPSALVVIERRAGAFVDGSLTWGEDEFALSRDSGELVARAVTSGRKIGSRTCQVRTGPIARDERGTISTNSVESRKPRRPPPVPIPGATYGARVLVATDYQLFLNEGQDLTAMAASILKSFARISQLLEEQVGLRLEVGEISMRDTPGDAPWDQGGAAAYLADHPVRAYPRGFVSLLQGDYGGVGDLASLCSAYDSTGSSAPDLAVSSFGVQTMAHEIGHVLGSDHTHCYGFTNSVHYQGLDDTSLVRGPDGAPPIDRCADQATCYQGPPVAQAPASIMSYCARASFSYGEEGKYGDHSERVLGLLRATIERAAARYPGCLDKVTDALNLRGEATGETSLRLHWNDIFDDETGWVVEQLGRRNRWATVGNVPAGATELDLAGLRSPSSQTFRLTATFQGNVSEPSLPVTVVIP